MFDLESYSAKYSGETRLQRLLMVARNTTDEALAAQAFRMAEHQMKADGNVKRYKQVFGGISAAGGSSGCGGYQPQRQGQQTAADQGAEGAGEKRNTNTHTNGTILYCTAISSRRDDAKYTHVFLPVKLYS